MDSMIWETKVKQKWICWWPACSILVVYERSSESSMAWLTSIGPNCANIHPLIHHWFTWNCIHQFPCIRVIFSTSCVSSFYCFWLNKCHKIELCVGMINTAVSSVSHIKPNAGGGRGAWGCGLSKNRVHMARQLIFTPLCTDLVFNFSTMQE